MALPIEANPTLRQNEIIKNAVLFFVQNTEKVGNTKLCKLLYFFDMEVYEETGFTATELTYYAKKRGPVPLRVLTELQGNARPNDTIGLSDVITKERKKTKRTSPDELFYIATRGAVFDSGCFSGFEYDILKKVANKYKTSTGAEMSEETHLEGTAWAQTKEGEELDFELEARLHCSSEKTDNRLYMQNITKEFREALAAGLI